jgi:hypothetical protein
VSSARGARRCAPPTEDSKCASTAASRPTAAPAYRPPDPRPPAWPSSTLQRTRSDAPVGSQLAPRRLNPSASIAGRFRIQWIRHSRSAARAHSVPVHCPPPVAHAGLFPVHRRPCAARARPHPARHLSMAARARPQVTPRAPTTLRRDEHDLCQRHAPRSQLRHSRPDR